MDAWNLSRVSTESVDDIVVDGSGQDFETDFRLGLDGDGQVSIAKFWVLLAILDRIFSGNLLEKCSLELVKSSGQLDSISTVSSSSSSWIIVGLIR